MHSLTFCEDVLLCWLYKPPHPQYDMPMLCNHAQDVLARVFENYYTLSEAAASGLEEGSMHQLNYYAAALDPAVALLGIRIKCPAVFITIAYRLSPN